jgi:transcription elongation factor S-II
MATAATRNREYYKTQFLTCFTTTNNAAAAATTTTPEHLLALATELERGIQRRYKSDADYTQKAEQILLNLNPQSYVKNTYLCANILNGAILPQNVVKLTPHELFPASWKDSLEKHKQKQNKEAVKPAASDMFQCPKCKKRETTYYEQQTRSGDEPMTVFISCVAAGCGKQWRM